MTTVTESKRTGDFLLSEANGNRSREVVTIAAGADLDPGTVLGQVTATGEYAQLNPAATDGTETAAAVLYEPAAASSAAVKAVVIARDAEVADIRLVWPAGITAAQKDTAKTQLASKHIIVR